MKINIGKIEEMVSAISKVEGKARSRRLDAEFVAECAKKAEKLLSSMGIPKASRKGCTVAISPERVANSYRGIADGTYATLERGSSDWFLVSVRRAPAGSCAYGSSERVRVYLSEGAKAAIPTSFSL